MPSLSMCSVLSSVRSTAEGNSVALHVVIERRFDSLDKWASDFIASAKSAAGWAMLAKHPVNGKLYNVVSDEHAMGVL